MTTKIPYEIINHAKRKILSVKEQAWFELTDKYFQAFYSYKCIEGITEEDDSLKEEVIYRGIVTFPKEQIAVIHLAFGHTAKKYYIEIATIASDTYTLFYESWTEAKKVYDVVFNWKYNI